MNDLSHYHQPAALGHLSLEEWLEADELRAVNRHLSTVRAYRRILDTARAEIAALDAEVLDRCLHGWDQQTILDTLADLGTDRIPDAEIQARALEAFSDANDF